MTDYFHGWAATAGVQIFVIVLTKYEGMQTCFIYRVNPFFHPDILTQVYNKMDY